jgi:hypothetical protein
MSGSKKVSIEDFESLAAIRDMYLIMLGLSRDCVPFSPSNTISQVVEGQSMVPVDWPYIPIVKVSGRQQESSQESEVVTTSAEHSTEDVCRGLQWLLILDAIQPDILDRMLSPTAQLCRLSCIYLSGGSS